MISRLDRGVSLPGVVNKEIAANPARFTDWSFKPRIFSERDFAAGSDDPPLREPIRQTSPQLSQPNHPFDLVEVNFNHRRAPRGPSLPGSHIFHWLGDGINNGILERSSGAPSVASSAADPADSRHVGSNTAADKQLHHFRPGLVLRFD